MTIKIETEIIPVEEFEEDVHLDVLSLGKEVFIQPTLYEKYHNYVTNISYERDQLKQKVEFEKDILSLDIREAPEDFGLNKLTEKTIDAVVNTDDKIVELSKDLLYVNKLVKEAEGALKAITDKGFSLKSAVQMYTTGYWGDLTALPRKMQEDIDEYLNKKEMSSSLDNNKRLTKRSKKNGEKEK